MRRPGDPVVLRALWWDGGEPAPGDVLRTRTGRQYLVRRIEGRRVECIVLPPGFEPPAGTGIWEWTWASRRRRTDDLPG